MSPSTTTPRSCEQCGKASPGGITKYAVQYPSGRVVGVWLHLRCLPKLRAALAAAARRGEQ